jgi:hypothetical protein
MSRSEQPPNDEHPYWRNSDGPVKYTARVWCTTHGKVDPDGSEFCPECNSILLTKGAYIASDGHGHRKFGGSH